MLGYINAGESIGIAFSTLISYAGFKIFIMSAVFLKMINHKSLFKYGSAVITRNEFEGMAIY
ncbi:hypothetical protein BG003_008242 [Podila horticola]|nr:hypothetical protein BG003_008242 [Podila horticola]